MPDFSDIIDGYYGNEDYLICVFCVLFLFLCIAKIFDFIHEYKEKKKQKEIEEFYDVLAESDMRTSFTCSEEE